MADEKALAVFFGSVAVVFIYGGLTGKSPLKAIQSIIQGKPPTAATQGYPISAATTSSGTTSSTQLDTNAAIPGVTTGIPAGVAANGTPTANQGLGQLMAAAYGWTGDNWLCLKTGWEEESGWNQYAANVPSDPYNHAYGIPQANPGTKMASAGSDWKTSPTTQIRWGLAYIKAIYGSPSQVPHWSVNGPTAGYVGY